MKINELMTGITQLAEKCWDTHKQVGMKKKGNRMVPDCRPKEGVEEGTEFGSYYYEQLAQELFDANPTLDASGRAEDLLDAAFPLMVRDLGNKRKADNLINGDEDFASDFVSAYAGLQRDSKEDSLQERVSGEWLEIYAKAKELLAQGMTVDQVAKQLGVQGPNNGMAGGMGGNWGAINKAANEFKQSQMNLPSSIKVYDESIEELHRVLELSGLNLSADEQFDMIELMVESLAQQHGVDAEIIWEDFESVDDEELLSESAAWRNSSGKSKKGGLNAKGVASYRRENPGSKLQMAVTTKPSKLKPGSKAAKRRKSFCARMGGNKGPMKKPNGDPTRKALALRKWNC